MSFEKYDCILEVKNKNSKCKQTTCRHFLDSEQHLNCSIIAADSGPMTLQEIGDFYGISRMRVCQIEKAILKKIKSAPGDLREFD